MPKKQKSIPVNSMAHDSSEGIVIEKLSFNDLPAHDKAILESDEAKESHRHDRHSFFLLESGTVDIEIDFQKYTIVSPSVIYLHPDQVHRTTAFNDVIVSSWAIDNENLNPEYLNLLEDITPAAPLKLSPETFSLITDATSLTVKLFGLKNNKLHHSLLKDSCNTLIALVIAQYLEQSKPADALSRFESVAKTFRQLLERNYTTIKRPADYAGKINITTAYLNECVKNTTGHPVSYHIHQRIILEAKRLLYHSDTSVKEIAVVLGYDDYPYFSRLFTKVTGMTAVTFRNKNHD
ncbi:AraC family transcriptional regulator [Flavobacterium rivuli WB 3.3-2 = DSM 21788]|uniref:AraC family transcriptional regulator n=1 Tax=Flavobacterium rivuli WB 3.3-2 = DSM 21788 TaxID=1121895 RepID=A0A0A2LXY5_9FLAO|nr:helix-turn-helix domain-containing protein [Flavobacterium rivuli]KGO85232.1 AraC family transcriptional regulator [Flavobacterium rivuli WB 3.3-2 = DSM 21788]